MEKENRIHWIAAGLLILACLLVLAARCPAAEAVFDVPWTGPAPDLRLTNEETPARDVGYSRVSSKPGEPGRARVRVYATEARIAAMEADPKFIRIDPQE